MVTNAQMLNGAKLLVLKIGSSLLVDPASGRLRRTWLESMADDIATAKAAGTQVILVSSGAIALGRRMLGLGLGRLTLEQSQAAASVGQIRLAQAWSEALSARGLTASQVLLTLGDTQDRRRYLNGCATLKTLLDLGVVPVVNENDTVATDEIRYGDNDRLAARVALMAGADRLILFSDVDGLYTANPREVPDAQHLSVVADITPEIEAMAGGTGSAHSKGGMKTKLIAAKTAVQGGCAMAIARGEVIHPLSALLQGARSTWFLAAATPAAARKQWIGGMKPVGSLVVDAGALAALRKGKSLLPAGVRRVIGQFERGDPVSIELEDGTGIGTALSGYSAEEARQAAGKRSDALATLLQGPVREEIVHRDDLVIWGL